MRTSHLIYTRLALVFILLSFGFFILKIIRIPGDTVVMGLPDTTLHDIIYFNAENFVNLCGLVAFTNITYLASSCYADSSIILWLRRIALSMSAIIFIRCIGHVFTYYIVTPYELIADVILITLLFISKPLYRSHATDD